MPAWQLSAPIRVRGITGAVAVAGDIAHASALTSATLAGPSNAPVATDLTYTVTLNADANQTFRIQLTCPGATVTPSSYDITAGNRVASFTVQGPSPGSYTVDFDIIVGPALARVGRPIALTLGQLVHDGPATPEQISLWLPYTGPQTTTATCRYRVQGAGSWTTGHPLYRVQPTYSSVPNTGGAIADGFAWPIIGLTPGTTYEVEVTLSTGPVYALTHTTRSLPAAAGAATRTANSIATIQTQLSALTAGDVLQIAAGDYTITAGTSLQISNKTGTEGAPIYVRGASRAGTIIRKTDAGTMFYVIGGRRVIFENMTLVGSATTSTYIRAFGLYDGAQNNYITVRNITASGLSSFFYAQSTNQADGEIGAVGCLVYNNTVAGIGQWSTSPTDYLGSSTMWSNDGININGAGSCAFNNTISGFGDTFACATHVGGDSYTSARGVHVYRNDIRNSCDDVFEADYGRRNITFYDNRCHNVINAMSLDPLHGGPYLHARNIYVNLYRMRPFKLNTLGSGFFIYNNTLIEGTSPETVGGTKTASYISGGSGSIYHRHYGYRNNVFVWQGGATTDVMFYHENTAHDPIDWSYNSHYPDAQIRFGSLAYQTNLAGAQTNWPASTPVFSGLTQRFANDTILASAQPFTQTITVGASTTEIIATYTPTLASGTAKNSGVVIPNITDGYSGAAPDRGAVIEGRSAVEFGDIPSWVPAANTVTSLGASTALATAAGESPGFFAAWCGMSWAPWLGARGSVIVGNGGHTDGTRNWLWRYDVASLTWTQIKAAASTFAKSGDTPPYTDISDPDGSGWLWANSTTGDRTKQTGQPAPIHSCAMMTALPPNAVTGQTAANGWLFFAGMQGSGVSGQLGSQNGFLLRIGDADWAHHGTMAVGTKIASLWLHHAFAAGAAYDPMRKRVSYHATTTASGIAVSARDGYRSTDDGSAGDLLYTDSGGGSSPPEWGQWYTVREYMAAYDCIVEVQRNGTSPLRVVVMDQAAGRAYEPSQSGTNPGLSNALACSWSDRLGALVFIDTTIATDRLWFLKPTGDPRTAAWAWSQRVLGGESLLASNANPNMNRVRNVFDNVLLWFSRDVYQAQAINVTPP